MHRRHPRVFRFFALLALAAACGLAVRTRASSRTVVIPAAAVQQALSFDPYAPDAASATTSDTAEVTVLTDPVRVTRYDVDRSIIQPPYPSPF
jgi:hypothetical protein